MFEFVNNEAIPGTGVVSEDFWSKFSKVVHELTPINKALIKKRETVQKKIDDWHVSNKGKDFDKEQYVEFLKSINYLVEENDDFEIKTKNVEDRVFIHGNKNRDEVKKFYSENNLMILPSVSEGLARVIFESQVTTCPVLVTDAPGMQDIVIDGQTGYVFESNNLNSMIKKINHVIQNYNEATSVGINAKEFILSNYSSDNFKFSFQKIFDTV